MKMLKELFERIKPMYEDGGRFAALRPLFEALENFWFAPDKRTSGAPHLLDPLDLKRYMSMVIIGLLPCVAASVYFFGLRVIAMIVVSYAAGGIVEVVVACLRKEEINEGFLVTGLIFPLVLPPALPLWMVAVGCMFGVLVGKEIFGGTGRNLFNPALIGRCFLLLSYSKEMTGNWIRPSNGLTGRLFEYVHADSGADVVTSATPLVAAKSGEYADIWRVATGYITGSVGETSAIAILIGGIFLVLTRVANWRSVVGVLGSYFVLGTILHEVAPDTFGQTGWYMLAGGLLFGAFFMVTDPVSAPGTNPARWMYGAFIGMTTLLIRSLTDAGEGMMYAILLGNIVGPLLDEIVVRYRVRRLSVYLRKS